MFLNRLFQVRRVIEECVPISGLDGRRRDEEDQGPLHLHGRERRSRPAGGAGEMVWMAPLVPDMRLSKRKNSFCQDMSHIFHMA